MLERCYRADEFAKLEGISKSKAYEIMSNEMPNRKHPLRVTEGAIREWREQNMIYPIGALKRKGRKAG